MTFDYTFGLELPELRRIISTEQFKLSEELMDLRFELSFSEQDMAQIIDISLQEYLQMEFAMEDIPIEKYRTALEKVRKYTIQKHSHNPFKIHFIISNSTETSYSSHCKVNYVSNLSSHKPYKFITEEMNPFKARSKIKSHRFVFNEPFHPHELSFTKQIDDNNKFDKQNEYFYEYDDLAIISI
mgnify:CR=1 FL=1